MNLKWKSLSKKLDNVFVLGCIFYILLTSCSLLTSRYKNIDPELQTYVDDIKELSNGNLGHKITGMGFNDELESHILGRCHIVLGEVSINPEYWKKLDYASRIVLIAHELIHCSKLSLHKNGVDEWGCPQSIMHKHAGGTWCNNKNWFTYIKEMREWK